MSNNSPRLCKNLVIRDAAINLDNIDKELLQILQDNFPMTENPWKEIGNKLDLPEEEVLTRLKRLNQLRVIQKIGAVLNTSKIGFAAATLIAVKVPPQRIDEVADVINQSSGVSHNYEREHEYNVWFTVKAHSEKELAAAVDEITQKAAIPQKDLLNLPTKKCFKILVRFQIAQS
jgi:DNA-binding Lrp family transcriptional regulator